MKRGYFGEDRFLSNKSGQVAVFIIIAILVVGLAILFYFLKPGITSTTQFEETNPNAFIQSCIKEDIENAIEVVSLQGGSINPENFILYKSNRVEYLCYTTEFYKTCVVQQPLLKQHIESEVEDEIREEVDGCFEELKKSYEDRGYNVNLEEGSAEDVIRVELLPKRIVTSFSYVLTASKGETKRYDSFNVILNNNLYELVAISDSIIDWESEFGDADSGFYMSIYPDLKVEKFNQQDGSTVYVLTDRNNNKIFQFASRSLAWPPGVSIDGVATN